MEADGWSLDDKRQELLPFDKFGSTPIESLTKAEHNDPSNLVSRYTRIGD
jgi:type I restriction enzyme M protein